MNFKQLLTIVLLIFLSACKKDYTITKIEGKRIEINDQLSSDDSVEAFIKPYREHVNKDLDSVLAYAADTYSKRDGDLNTAIGNFMASTFS